MDEPVTWGDLIIARALWIIIMFLVLVALTVLIAIATKWEQWKDKQPDWNNEWENEEK